VTFYWHEYGGYTVVSGGLKTDGIAFSWPGDYAETVRKYG
jgi:hypothetical protein